MTEIFTRSQIIRLFLFVIVYLSQFKLKSRLYPEFKSLNKYVESYWPREKFMKIFFEFARNFLLGSPLLCLSVKNFGFVLFVNIWTEIHLLFACFRMKILKIVDIFCCEYWCSKNDQFFFHARRAPIWSILLSKLMPWFDGSKVTFKGQLEKTNL